MIFRQSFNLIICTTRQSEYLIAFTAWSSSNLITYSLSRLILKIFLKSTLYRLYHCLVWNWYSKQFKQLASVFFIFYLGFLSLLSYFFFLLLDKKEDFFTRYVSFWSYSGQKECILDWNSWHKIWKKKVREKSRECHNHKPHRILYILEFVSFKSFVWLQSNIGSAKRWYFFNSKTTCRYSTTFVHFQIFIFISFPPPT